MSNFDKYFISPFNIKYFETHFDKDAETQKAAQLKEEIQSLFLEFKNALDAMEAVIGGTDNNEDLRNAFNDIVDKFAQIEINVNKL